MKPNKILIGLASLALISFLAVSTVGIVGCKETNKDTTTVAPPAGAALAAFPNNSFYCLRAGQDTVREWLQTNGASDRHSRVVFKYFWPDRARNEFTLITELNLRADRTQFNANTDTLGREGLCQVQGISNALVLGSNQVSIQTLRRLWGYATDPSVYYWLKFTPMIRPDPAGTGNPCCINHLVYRIDLMPTPGGPGSAYEEGYTNPSPPRQPED